jgi:hypothetical protein
MGDVVAFGGAVLSSDRRHRYRLWRATGLLNRQKRCTFVMLNPSVANESKDDPTLRRCLRYARDWGFGRLDVVNLFSLITSDPKVLRAAKPEDLDLTTAARELNNQYILEACRGALVVCAWGANGSFIGRDTAVLAVLEHEKIPVHALAFTKHHAPKHPLRLRADLHPIPWLHDKCSFSVCRP